MADKVVNLSSLQPQLQSMFRETAKANGWPEHIVGKTQVTIHNDRLYLSHGDTPKSEIENLEYGYKSTPPRPAIRSFKRDAQVPIAEAMARHMVKIIFGANLK